MAKEMQSMQADMPPSRLRGISRRAALLAPLALSGCGLWDDWFGTHKPRLPGKREQVMPLRHALEMTGAPVRPTLPAPVPNAGWPQTGGNPAHLMGHLAAAPDLREAWSADIGAGGGYRRALLAQPVVAAGQVYTMDSRGFISAFRLSDGRHLWRFDSRPKKDWNFNVGGGLGIAGGVLFAVNGLGALVALDAASGKLHWRQEVGAPARSAPTIADGRIYFSTIEDKLLAHAVDDGRALWTYQAASTGQALLGQPAPAFSDGLVVAGFGSGELATLRADSGSVVWTDNLGTVDASSALAAFSSIRGLPVIAGSTVFAIGVGGLMVALDLHSGRHLWERSVAGIDTPWVAGDWVFVVALDQKIAALNARDGSVGWVTQLPRFKNEKKQKHPITWYGPVLASNRLVVAGTDQNAVAISPFTGAVLGRQRLSDAAAMGPILADGTLLLVTEDGRLRALR